MFPHADELSQPLKPHALSNLLARPWFRRRWVVQEISVAQQATFMCGDQELSWRAFSTAISSLAGVEGSSLTFTMPALRLVELGSQDAIRLSEWSVQDGFRISPLHGLEAYRDFDCKDHRDRIAALRFVLVNKALRVRSGRPPLALDYSLSVERTYLTFAEWWLLTRQEHQEDTIVTLLQTAARRQHTKLEMFEDLPTWVPDWRVQPFNCFQPDAQP